MGTPTATIFVPWHALDDVIGGAWITPPFNAANFFAVGGMTWTVAAGQVETYSYTRSGATLLAHISVIGSLLAGTASPALQLRLPGGFATARTYRGVFTVGGASGDQLGVWYLNGSVFDLFVNPAGTNWTLGPAHVMGIDFVGEIL